MQVSDGTVLMYIVPCLAVVWELFLFCYYGSKLSAKSFELLDALYESMWYEYPIEYQRYVMVMMMRMQRPLVLTGYDVVLCTLPTFTTVHLQFDSLGVICLQFEYFRYCAPLAPSSPCFRAWNRTPLFGSSAVLIRTINKTDIILRIPIAGSHKSHASNDTSN